MTQPPLIDHSWVGIECLIQGSGAKTLVKRDRADSEAHFQTDHEIENEEPMRRTPADADEAAEQALAEAALASRSK